MAAVLLVRKLAPMPRKHSDRSSSLPRVRLTKAQRELLLRL